MAPHKCLKNLVITPIYPLTIVASDKTKYPLDKVPTYIQNLGGVFTAKFTDKTTHLVVSEKVWKAQSGVIDDARAAIEAGRKIRVLRPEWLFNTLLTGKKHKESQYQWVMAGKDGSQMSIGGEGVKMASSSSGLMEEVFRESTDMHLGAKERRQVEKQFEADQAIALEQLKEKDKAKKEAQIERREQEKALLGKSKKGGEFADSHHIYIDTTGFACNVTLTKVDSMRNRNERVTLTIYETNGVLATSAPHLPKPSPGKRGYTLNLHSAGTGLMPANRQVLTNHCNLPTALLAFERCFKEKTGVAWADRLGTSSTSRDREQTRGGNSAVRDAGRTVMSAVGGGQKGGSEGWEGKMFVYHPPLHGSKGAVKPTVSPVMDVETEVDGVNIVTSTQDFVYDTHPDGEQATEADFDFFMTAPASSTHDSTDLAVKSAQLDERMEVDESVFFDAEHPFPGTGVGTGIDIGPEQDHRDAPTAMHNTWDFDLGLAARASAAVVNVPDTVEDPEEALDVGGEVVDGVIGYPTQTGDAETDEVEATQEVPHTQMARDAQIQLDRQLAGDGDDDAAADSAFSRKRKFRASSPGPDDENAAKRLKRQDRSEMSAESRSSNSPGRNGEQQTDSHDGREEYTLQSAASIWDVNPNEVPRGLQAGGGSEQTDTDASLTHDQTSTDLEATVQGSA